MKATAHGVIGRGVKECYVNDDNILIFVMTDGKEIPVGFTGELKGIVPIELGGTNAKTAYEARKNLGITPKNIGAATSTELEIERKRIDNLSSLKDGSTTGDAELTDIRVDYNGHTHSTAGNAVRSQVRELKGDLQEQTTAIADLVILHESNQLFDYENADVHHYYNASGVQSDRADLTGQFIPVESDTKYTISGVHTYCALFDRRKGWLSSFSTNDTDAYTVTTTSQSKYLYVSSENNRIRYIMVNKGESALPYEKYFLRKYMKYVNEEEHDNVSKLNKNVADIKLMTDINYGDLISGKYIAKKNGQAVALENYDCTDYIDVSLFSELRYKQTFLSGAGCAFYTSAKVFIVGYGNDDFDTESYKSISIPKNAKYFRISKINISESIDITGRLFERLQNYVNENSIENCMRIFRKIGIVGDSLSSGELAYVNDSGVERYVDRFDTSWLSILSRKNGSVYEHYSQGGMTAKKWTENTGGLKTKLQNDSVCNAYFIALGTNDISQSYSKGSATDSESTGTFAGYIKSIINTIHTKAPNACIFIMSLYNTHETSIAYSNLLKEISNLYDYCFYIDYINNASIYTNTGGVYTNLNHFTSIGYAIVADTIYKQCASVVFDNAEWFKFFTLYN